MGTITLNTDIGPVNFEIAGEKPTAVETTRINRILDTQISKMRSDFKRQKLQATLISLIQRRALKALDYALL